MTANAFRRLALDLDGASGAAHRGHPAFCVRGRIFATLGDPDHRHGCVMLTPEQQQVCLREHPGVFVPAPGTQGEDGVTGVRLELANELVVRDALAWAWQNALAEAALGASATFRPEPT